MLFYFETFVGMASRHCTLLLSSKILATKVLYCDKMDISEGISKRDAEPKSGIDFLEGLQYASKNIF